MSAIGVAISSAFACFSRGYSPLTAGISVVGIDFIFFLMISTRIRHERQKSVELAKALGVARRQHL